MKLSVSNLPEPLIVKKYSFPVSTPVYQLTINGKKCDATYTQGSNPKNSYTYFLWEGTSYYVQGHISPLATATLGK